MPPPAWRLRLRSGARGAWARARGPLTPAVSLSARMASAMRHNHFSALSSDGVARIPAGDILMRSPRITNGLPHSLLCSASADGPRSALTRRTRQPRACSACANDRARARKQTRAPAPASAARRAEKKSSTYFRIGICKNLSRDSCNQRADPFPSVHAGNLAVAQGASSRGAARRSPPVPKGKEVCRAKMASPLYLNATYANLL